MNKNQKRHIARLSAMAWLSIAWNICGWIQCADTCRM